MNKAVKIFLVLLFALTLAVALIGCGVSWVWGGARFFPKDAMEAVSIGAGKQEHIVADSCYFYYRTVADEYGAVGELDGWICQVTPVKQNGIGMWSADPDSRGRLVYTEDVAESIAALVVVESNGKYHNFLIPFFVYGEAPSLPEGFPSVCNKICVNDAEYELFKHSYFVTEAEVTEFEIDGKSFTVGK